MAKPHKGDAPVNVTEIDLGEKIDQAIQSEAVRMAGAKGKSQGKGASPSKSSRPGAGAGAPYRPGMYGGFRPSWAGRPGSQMGDSSLGAFLKMPAGLKDSVKPLLTGGLVGTAGNRVIAYVVPGLIKTDSAIATDTIAFGIGLMPFLFKKNAFTVGLALPGLFFLAGSLAMYALEKTQVLGQRPSVSGIRGAQPTQALSDARSKLAEARNRMQAARNQGAQVRVPRVVAQRRVA